MSTKFYAVNRESGKRWTPDPYKTAHNIHQYLVITNCGRLGVIENNFNSSISFMKNEDWEVVDIDAEI